MTDEALAALFLSTLEEAPLIAILRGIQPNEAEAVGAALVEAGIRLVEVPLNSPDPFNSIARLVKRFGETALIGAGTVLAAEAVTELAKIGASLVISPNTDVSVISAARAAGLVAIPGAATPSECFTAIKAGASALKLFPMEMIGLTGVKAMKAVLPAEIPLIAVGGVGAANVVSFRAAGCQGFGLGSSLYKPGMRPDAVKAAALACLDALKAG
jgi:2-dehydro-3-deoxyphosphogalactonate aldolase